MTPDDDPRPRPDDPDAPAPSARDERASAIVDGWHGHGDEPDAGQPPEVVARAAEMDDARAALRHVPDAGAPARERAVAAALAAYDEAAGRDSTDVQGRVADLGARRRRAAKRGRWLGAAAAVVLLVGVIVAGLVGSSPDDSTTDSATAELDTADSAPGSAQSTGGEEADDEAAEEAPSGGGTDSTLAESQLGDALSPTVDLGTFDSADDLLDAAADRPEAQRQPAGVPEPRSDADASPDSAPPPCPAGVPDPFERAAGPLLLANGVVDGVTVGVWRVGAPEAARLVVVDPGCVVLAERPVG
jgi:hypothetical protein